MSRPVGPPSKFSEPRAARLIEALKAGMTRGAACGHAEIAYMTLYRWAKKHPKFAAQLEEAELMAEARFTAVLAKAAFGHQVVKTKTAQKKDGESETTTESYYEYDWRAALEWLKRRRKKDWGDNVHVDLDKEITGLMAQLVGERQDRAEGSASD